MILALRCEATKQIHRGEATPDLPANIQKVALRKLQRLDLAKKSTTYGSLLAIDWNRSSATAKVSIPSASITNTACVSSGPKAESKTSKS